MLALVHVLCLFAFGCNILRPSEVLWSEGFETVLEFLQVRASALPRQTWLLQSMRAGASAEWITVGFTPDLETN